MVRKSIKLVNGLYFKENKKNSFGNDIELDPHHYKKMSNRLQLPILYIKV